MEKYRSHGESSSVSDPASDNNSDSAASYLTSLCDSGPIQRIYDALGHDSQLHIVGGTIRDHLVGLDNSDIDLTTILHPEEVARLLKENSISIYETGLKHGTLTALIDDSHIEITTFRSIPGQTSSPYSDSILTDLSARDFTINSIAFNVANKSLIDPFNGQIDLKNNLLKAVGSATDRLIEDPLRVMRFIRFGAASGREIDHSLKKAIINNVTKLSTISVERIRCELEKILVSNYPKEAMRAMVDFGILKFVIPELLPSVGFEQNKFHNEDVFEHTLSVIAAAPPTVRMRLAALFHDIGKPESMFVDHAGIRRFHSHEEIGYRISKEVMKRLKFSNEEIDAVSQLVKLHMRPIDCGPPGVRRLIRDLGDLYTDWRSLKIADAPPIMPREEFEANLDNFDKLVASEQERLAKVQNKIILIGGKDILELGEPAGPRVGVILKALEEIVIEDPELNTREILLEKARQMLTK